MTNIVAIVGPGTAFPGSSSTRLEDFADGLDNTILLAEITASDICWLEPKDLRVTEQQKQRTNLSLYAGIRYFDSAPSSRRSIPWRNGKPFAEKVLPLANRKGMGKLALFIHRINLDQFPAYISRFPVK